MAAAHAVSLKCYAVSQHKAGRAGEQRAGAEPERAGRRAILSAGLTACAVFLSPAGARADDDDDAPPPSAFIQVQLYHVKIIYIIL